VAEYSDVRPGVRIFILLLLLVVLGLGGVIWFDYLGLLDAKAVLSPLYGLLGMQRRGPAANPDDPNLLDRERLSRQADAVALQQEDLAVRASVLDARDKELAQLAQDLADREASVDSREKAFNERVKAFENRRVNLVQNAKYLVGMPPANARDILVKMEDQDVIDIFRIVEDEARKAGEQSMVAYWLSIMPADRAATLQRKMARKPGG
jgi:flagellar protein FlbB